MTASSAEASEKVAAAWAEKEKPYADPTIPQPVEKARPVDFDVVRTRTGTVKSVTFGDELPAGAALFVKKMIKSGGWEIHISRAVGTWTNIDGTPATKRIMQEIQGVTATGRQKMEKIGEEPIGPQVSLLVRGLVRDSGSVSRMLWGHWVGADFEAGGDWHRDFGPESLGWQSGVSKRAEESGAADGR